MRIPPRGPLASLRARADSAAPDQEVTWRSSADSFHPPPLATARAAFQTAEENLRASPPQSAEEAAAHEQALLVTSAAVLAAQNISFELVSSPAPQGRQEWLRVLPDKGSPLGKLARALEPHEATVSYVPRLQVSRPNMVAAWSPYDRQMFLDHSSLTDGRLSDGAGHETVHFRRFVRRNAGVLEPYQIRSVSPQGLLPGGLGQPSYAQMQCSDEVHCYARDVRVYLHELLLSLEEGRRPPEEVLNRMGSALGLGLDTASRQFAIQNALHAAMERDEAVQVFSASAEGWPCMRVEVPATAAHDAFCVEVGLAGSEGPDDPRNAELFDAQLLGTLERTAVEGRRFQAAAELFRETLQRPETGDFSSLVARWREVQAQLSARPTPGSSA